MKIQSTELEIKILETVVNDAQEWVQNAFSSRVNEQKKSMIRHIVEYCLENSISIPNSEDKIIQVGFDNGVFKSLKELESMTEPSALDTLADGNIVT